MFRPPTHSRFALRILFVSSFSPPPPFPFTGGLRLPGSYLWPFFRLIRLRWGVRGQSSRLCMTSFPFPLFLVSFLGPIGLTSSEFRDSTIVYFPAARAEVSLSLHVSLKWKGRIFNPSNSRDFPLLYSIVKPPPALKLSLPASVPMTRLLPFKKNSLFSFHPRRALFPFFLTVQGDFAFLYPLGVFFFFCEESLSLLPPSP